MAHSDNATKAWVSAIPTKNADGHVTKWNCQYKYTLAVSGKDDFVNIFKKLVIIESPSKAPSSYTKTEILNQCRTEHWDLMFNKKYSHHLTLSSKTIDTDFDVSGLN